MERVLITGISGGQGQLIAQHLLASGTANNRVYGVDRKPWPGRPREIRMTVRTSAAGSSKTSYVE